MFIAECADWSLMAHGSGRARFLVEYFVLEPYGSWVSEHSPLPTLHSNFHGSVHYLGYLLFSRPPSVLAFYD